MKILLIAPARKPEWGESFWDLKTFAKITRKKAAGVLLSLPTLAALTPNEIDIHIIDENIEPIDFNKKADLVGISFLTSLAPRAYEIADRFKERGIKVVLGGIHASMLPDEAINHADSVIIGEAEETWPQVIKDFKNNSLKKFYKADCYPDLTKSPIPRWDLVKTDKYCYFTVQAGRGCPYNCDFCSVHKFNGRKYRYKKVSKVIEEIQLLKSIDSKKLIFFADDNLLTKYSYAEELLRALEPLNIRFWAQASINTLDDDKILRQLYNSGCRAVFIGFESISEKGIKHLKKDNINKVNLYHDVINRIHSCGIGVFGSFILGSDNENPDEANDIFQFINQTNIAFSMINILTPFPGTELYKTLNMEKQIISNNWENFNAEKLVTTSINNKNIIAKRKWLLKKTNSYSAIYKRLSNLWSNGAFVRFDKNNISKFTKGRILFSLYSLFSLNFRRTWFILRSLWNDNLPSVSAITLAINFNYYANILKKND